MWRPLERALHVIVTAKAEIAQAILVLAGWTLLTRGLAAALPHAPVWPFSAGLLFLSLAGWKFLYGLATKGLYLADREGRR